MLDILYLLPQPGTATVHARPWDDAQALSTMGIPRTIERYNRPRPSGTALPILNETPPTVGVQLLGSQGSTPNYPPDFLSAIKRLRTMSAYSDNWDAEGAPAPDPDSIQAAIVLIGFLSPENLRIRASLDAEGRPLILLSRENEEGEIVMTSKTTFNFVWFGANEAGDIDVQFDGRSLPAALKDVIPKYSCAATT